MCIQAGCHEYIVATFTVGAKQTRHMCQPVCVFEQQRVYLTENHLMKLHVRRFLRPVCVHGGHTSQSHFHKKHSHRRSWSSRKENIHRNRLSTTNVT